MAAVRALVVALTCLVGFCLPLDPAAAQQQAAPALDRPTARSTSVLFTGHARPRAVVRIQVHSGSRWLTVRTTRAARSGAYRVATRYPTKRRAYRALSNGRASVVRRVAPPTPPTPPPPAVVPVAPAPQDACGERPKRSDGSYWSCSFHDDFDGTALDRTKWMAQETSFSGMYSGHQGCYVDNDRTIAVASGTLRLSSTMLDEPFVCSSPYGDFTTTSEVATVVTKSLFTQTYGRFAARLKFPAESGIAGSHAAFWLYPQEHLYGPWPGSGEIDVAEWFSGMPANVYPSVHYAGEDTSLSTGYGCSMATASTDFHTYVVEWTPTTMTFSYDGKQCFTHQWTPDGLTGSQPFDQPFYAVLTQIWGAGWNAPGEEMARTSTLVVDWVRAWQ